MKYIEKFLKSNLYLILVNAIAFVAFILPESNRVVSQLLIVILLIGFAFLLISFRNALYTIPIVFGLMYSYNQTNPNLSNMNGFNFIYLIPILLFAAILIHFIRYKPKFKLGVLSKPYLFIAIAYLASIFSVTITGTYLQLSLVGFLYLLMYQFFRQTLETDESNLMRVLFFASVLLVAEITYTVGYTFFTENLTHSLLDRVLLGMEESWYREDYGWGNINDVVIHLTLLLGAQFYYILKYPKHILWWSIPLFSGFMVLLTASRGGYVGVFIAFLIFIPYLIKHTDKKGKINAVYVLLLVIFAMYLLNPLIRIAYELAIQGGLDNLDNFTSDRTVLYRNALEIYKKFPLFGGGWEAMIDRVNPDRIQVFHSTLFHTLAVMGTFGLIVLIYYFVKTFQYLFNNRSLAKDMILIGIIASQTVGLFDNTMYMLLYTVASLILFSSLETIRTT